MLGLGRAPGVELVGRSYPLEGMTLSSSTLHGSETTLEGRTQLIQQLDQAVTEVTRGRGFGVEALLAGLVDEETTGTRGQVVLLFLEGHHVQVHEVAVKLARTRRWIPTRSRQYLTKFIYSIQLSTSQNFLHQN